MGRRPGFFLTELPASVLGDAFPPITAALAEASRWLHPRLLDRSFADQTRAELTEHGHLFITEVLRAPRAEVLSQSLAAAHFVPHHHAEYPLAIAPLAQQGDSPLAGFMGWLGSDEGVRYHLWLSGIDAEIIKVQVQCSRMRDGDRFPPHVDTWADTLAVVYNLTSDRVEGGVLHFIDEGLEVPRQFNSVFAFLSRGRRHEVTAVRGEGSRYSVTAFYVFGTEG